MQSNNNVGRNIDRVHPAVGGSAVGLLADDIDPQVVTRKSGITVKVINLANIIAPRMSGGGVHAHRNIHLRVFHQAVLDHLFGTAEDFLAGLEHEFNASLQLRLMGFQKPRRAKKHRCVHVVTAAVAGFHLRGKGKTGFLIHRKGIHVASEQHHLSALSGHRHDTASPAGLGIVAVASQLLHHEFHGFGKVKSQLGIRVDLPAVGNDLVLDLHGFLFVIDHDFLL